jgi:hypothetical protein
MHGRFDRSRKVADDNIHRSWGLGFLAIGAIITLTLVALAVIQPAGSNWISEAVQAEFTTPDVAPIQFARPTNEIRIVRTN